MSIIEWGTNVVLDIIEGLWYPGIVLLMALESACMPVPGEIVMLFAGSLAYSGKFSIWGVALAGILGNLIGSTLAYLAGMRAGRPLILRYSRYLLLNKKHLDIAEEWFCKYGNITIFFSRFLPIMRTVISLPAGIAKMNFRRFLLYTGAGCVPWNFALAYAGYRMGEYWGEILDFFKKIEIAVVIGIVIVAIYLVRQSIRNAKIVKEMEEAGGGTCPTGPGDQDDE